MTEPRITLRSYRLAFELERRLHRIDRFRIPVPYGIPLIGLAYGFASAVAVLGASGLPVIGTLLIALPWPIRLVLIPAVAAHALCRKGADGRPAHEALAARALRRLREQRRAGLDRRCEPATTWLPVVTLVPDERSKRYRRSAVDGPAEVLLRLPARGRARRRTLDLEPIAGAPLFRAQALALKQDQRLRIR